MNYINVQTCSSFVLSNQLRIIYLPSISPISYCGFVVNAGARDERTNQFGLAHFVEHMLFKGTQKRKSRHIINRMGNVGGELNAYTTKEETFLYSICLLEDTERAMELLSDLIFHSLFPSSEIEKEKKVIIDEINSYNDNPLELIFDEFENLVFRESEMGHNILGEIDSLNTFTSQVCCEFTNIFYRPENMVFFFYGGMPFSKIIHLATKYFFKEKKHPFHKKSRITPQSLSSKKEKIEKKLYQSHVMIGGKGYDRHNKKQIGLYLLNNLLGGLGMNNRLNITLREKRGLVYTVESSLASYSDTGIFNIYFACTHQLVDKCLSLIYKELKKMREEELSISQLHTAIKQLKGQLGVASENKENLALNLGKSFLHFNKYNTLPEIYKKIDALKSSDLLEIANEIFDEKKIFQLIFE
ncbi:M16 family metallopeptidase [Candidatus Azobacteroides pseudotrichonymphae]|uniref:Zn-dependent protease n=1 Tax=Azobacteroides pseudotrichonymphae genomovar. CFP2 TaxID=511995 RepID=B6YR51_AZOPC|nr:pitrilysin family protein [Candidatus Azobacteroides pseudotrichonymphae]BAG83673.1 putative Zn-dependent protease [Candidatus Azobacteroides pseudotrichonymphae genomovar. CFP2]